MTFDQIETELSRRIATCHASAELMNNKTSVKKLHAKAQGLSEMLAWLRFQRKINRV